MSVSPPSSLREVLRDHRVVVCVGSGGVGKTTTAAALAVHAALSGKRVLCLTIDPAKRLANSLGLTRMTTQEQEVPASLFEAHGLELKGKLSAMMLDTKSTFDELVMRYASSKEVARRILDNEIYRYMSGSLAGTQEYMAMEKLHAVRRDARYELIVLDTPPTSNALDFLDAPERMANLVDSPAMRWFVQAFQGAGRFSFNLVGRSASLVLKGLSKFTGTGFLEVLAAFIMDFNDLFGGFRERAQAVAADLRGDDVAFVVVTSPRPLAIEEAIFFSNRLREAGMQRDGFVINGMQPVIAESSATDEALAEELRACLGALPGGGAGLEPAALIEKMWRALDDSRIRSVADRLEADRLRQRAGKEVLYVEVPALEQDVHDLGSLRKVAAYLTGEKRMDAIVS